MKFIDRLKAEVQTGEITQEERYFYLTSKLKEISKMPKEELKQTLLEAMDFASSWISIDDLEKILSEEDFSKIQNSMLDKIRNRYKAALEQNPDKKELVEQEFIPQDLKETVFKIVKGGDTYLIREAPYSLTSYSVDIDKIDVEKFKKVVQTSMKGHLGSGVFHDRGEVKAEWIKTILDKTITELNDENTVENKNKENVTK